MDVKKTPILGLIVKLMDDANMDYGPFMTVVAVIFFVLGLFLFGLTLGGVFSFILFLFPIWLPLILFALFFRKWMITVGKSFYLFNGRTTLRIIPPQEVTKSPEAMEFVISQIHNTANPDNLMQTYLDGKRPLPFSFEIVSIGGEMRFYVNVPTKKSKIAFEANMYSQYPGIEIREEPVDYAAEVPLDTKDWTIFSAHMGKKKDGVFPIKTYIDYGLDKMPKEEEKVDPMAPMLEVFASIKPHERLYMQIIATSIRPDSFKNGQLRLGEGEKWDEDVSKAVDEIMQRDSKSKGPIQKDDAADFDGMPRITPGERDTITAMERNAGKYPYNVGIRWVYMNEQGGFNSDIINPVIRSFSQYDVIGRNAIGVRWRTDFNYKNLIPGGKKKALASLKRQELKEYKLRKYFPKSGGDEPKIFTAEELATMFHVPGQVILTPTLTRIQSTRSEAPNNLPTGNPDNQ